MMGSEQNKIERPILFSGPMVQAVLAGRKTQTRRILKPKHLSIYYSKAIPAYLEACPYGQPGDRLWVRESFAMNIKGDKETKYIPPWYRADFDSYGLLGHDGVAPIYAEDLEWKPSIHMPRWACRILLEITGVRVERLHEISETDAQAEGVERVIAGSGWRRYCDPDSEEAGVPPCGDARRSFRSLWKLINGDESWNANPFVWVIEFKRVQP